MKESDIRDSNILKKYQKLVDEDVRKFFYNKKDFKDINYKSWGCKKVKKIFEKKRFKYYQCSHTKTIFANPRPKPELLEKFYSKTKSSTYWLNKFFLPKQKFSTCRREKNSARRRLDFFIIENFLFKL